MRAPRRTPTGCRNRPAGIRLLIRFRNCRWEAIRQSGPPLTSGTWLLARPGSGLSRCRRSIIAAQRLQHQAPSAESAADLPNLSRPSRRRHWPRQRSGQLYLGHTLRTGDLAAPPRGLGLGPLSPPQSDFGGRPSSARCWSPRLSLTSSRATTQQSAPDPRPRLWRRNWTLPHAALA